MDEVAAFYDALAEDYTAIFDEWDAAVVRQGQIIDRLIHRLAPDAEGELIDATCGIGTQAIGLALRGYSVTASDLSEASVIRARREAARLGAGLSFVVSDIRMLAANAPGPFDVAITFDNALPHLLTDADLGAALASLREVLRPGGLLLASVRDYDVALRTRPPGEPARVRGPVGARRMVAQAWEWSETGPTYRLLQFIGREDAGGGWHLRHLETTYRALRRVELAAAVEGAGFVDLSWHEPVDSGFYQPILAARRP